MTDWRLFLVRNPDVCSGQLTAKGTRIPVTVILDSIAEGSSRDAILGDYPSLTQAHIDAALADAAKLAREESLLPVSGM